jgi:hypothetical protein
MVPQPKKTRQIFATEIRRVQSIESSFIVKAKTGRLRLRTVDRSRRNLQRAKPQTNREIDDITVWRAYSL